MNYINTAVMFHRDLHRNQVVACLRFEGTDGSTVFTDEAGHTFTASGSAQIDTAQARYGGSSLLCDGTGDDAHAANSADWEMGSDDWFFEISGRYNALPGAGTSDAYIVASNGVNNPFMLQNDNVAGQHKIFAGVDVTTSAPFIYYDWSPSTGTWYDLGFGRNGDDLLLFVDGTLVATEPVSGSLRDNNPSLFIGQAFTVTNGFNGWLDAVRITKGACRETSDYVPRDFPRF
jgi:hypothetical protein